MEVTIQRKYKHSVIKIMGRFYVFPIFIANFALMKSVI